MTTPMMRGESPKKQYLPRRQHDNGPRNGNRYKESGQRTLFYSKESWPALIDNFKSKVAEKAGSSKEDTGSRSALVEAEGNNEGQAVTQKGVVDSNKEGNDLVPASTSLDPTKHSVVKVPGGENDKENMNPSFCLMQKKGCRT